MNRAQRWPLPEPDAELMHAGRRERAGRLAGGGLRLIASFAWSALRASVDALPASGGTGDVPRTGYYVPGDPYQRLERIQRQAARTNRFTLTSASTFLPVEVRTRARDLPNYHRIEKGVHVGPDGIAVRGLPQAGSTRVYRLPIESMRPRDGRLYADREGRRYRRRRILWLDTLRGSDVISVGGVLEDLALLGALAGWPPPVNLPSSLDGLPSGREQAGG